MLHARSSHRRLHVLKSWNFLILQMDGFLATDRGSYELRPDLHEDNVRVKDARHIVLHDL